ncbi:MAG: mannose-1-phosphate guanyltransferase [Hyphomicrobiales bacterium]|nr:MAG: mannose-1-phosphate guanyltransferase [Hyphomicrobiales bacterium]
MRRLLALIRKEFIQLRRDRLTLAMIISIPAMQLILFGYAINVTPHNLQTALLVQDHGELSRSFIGSLKATGYFSLVRRARNEAELDHLLRSGAVQFGIQIPPDFGRDVRRGTRPSLLVLADATDPATTGSAISALEGLQTRLFKRELRGPGAALAASQTPFEIRIHRRYNPSIKTPFNIVPALLGIILTMTMLIFTSQAVTREYERGTMEGLLVMPLGRLEIMIGKIVPFVLVGFVQMGIILLAGHFLFHVPMRGSLWLLLALASLFILANLAVGYTFSTLARNQLQAVQMSFMFFLPNIIMSGFAFPFRGMPVWAQHVGEVLPLTHFIRIVRGIMLKGAVMDDLMTDTLAIALFTLVAVAVAISRFRQTLD